MFCIILILTSILKFSSSRKVISGLSENNSLMQFTYNQSTNVEIFQIFSAQSLIGADYILFEVFISQQDMSKYNKTQDILPFMCYQYNSDPIINNSSSFNSPYLPPCSYGFDFNQYFRANGFYSVIIALPEQQKQFSFVTISVVISKYKINYQVKIRAHFQDNSVDVCPQDCNWSETVKATCRKGICSCPDDFIDYDCTSNAISITEYEKQITLNRLPNEITYAYYKINQSNVNAETAEKFKVINIEIQEIKDIQVEMYIHYEGVYPYKILPTKSLNNEMHVLTEENYSFVLEKQQIYDQNFQPKYVVFGFALVSSASTRLLQQSNSNPTILTIQVSENHSEQSNLVMILTYTISSAVAMVSVLWVVWTIRKACIHQERCRNPAMGPAMVFNLNNNKIVKKKRDRQTTELIEKIMPAVQYDLWINMIKPNSRKNNNDQCSVCLCEFVREDICREAICGHCFHKDCLEQWMQKQENCPFCRCDLSNQALIDFDKEKSKNLPQQSGNNLSLKIDGQETNNKNKHGSELQDTNQQKFQSQMIDQQDCHECSPELKRHIQKVMNNQFIAGRNCNTCEKQHLFTHQRYNSSILCSPAGEECSYRPSSRFLIDSNNDINICSNRDIEKRSEDYLLVNKEHLNSERQLFREINTETLISQIKLQFQSQEIQSNEELKFDDRVTSTIGPTFVIENIQQQTHSQDNFKRSQQLGERIYEVSDFQKDEISQETKRTG